MADVKGRVAIDFETNAEQSLGKIPRVLSQAAEAAARVQQKLAGVGREMETAGAKGGATGQWRSVLSTNMGGGSPLAALGLGGVSPLAMVKSVMDAGVAAAVSATTGPRGGDPDQRAAMQAYRGTQTGWGGFADKLSFLLDAEPLRQAFASLPLFGTIVQGWTSEIERVQREQARGREMDKALHDLQKKRDDAIKKAAEAFEKLPGQIERALVEGNQAAAEALTRAFRDAASAIDEREPIQKPLDEIAAAISAMVAADELDRQHDEDVMAVLKQMLEQGKITQKQMVSVATGLGVRDDLRVEGIETITGGF